MDISPGNGVPKRHGRCVMGFVLLLANASCGGAAAVPRTVGACAQPAPVGTWENVSPLPGSMPMPENAGMRGRWTAVPMPTSGASGVNAGSVQLAYDPSHHLLYSANHRSGLWRMVVP